MKNRYEINGDTTIIYTPAGIEFKISTSDLELLLSIKLSWRAHWNPTKTRQYIRTLKQINKKRTEIHLHSLLLKPSGGLVVDHINRDTLDNRRENLRLVTPAQNSQNKSVSDKRTSSGVRGVYWNKADEKWQAQAVINGKFRYFGQFTSLDDAAEVIKRVRLEHMPYSYEG